MFAYLAIQDPNEADSWLVVRRCASALDTIEVAGCSERAARAEVRRLASERAAELERLVRQRAEAAVPHALRHLAPGFYTDADAA